MENLTPEEITRIVEKSIDSDLESKEIEFAEKFGAIKLEPSTEEIKKEFDDLKGKEELDAEEITKEFPQESDGLEEKEKIDDSININIAGLAAPKTKKYFIEEILKIQEAKGIKNGHKKSKLWRMSLAELEELFSVILKEEIKNHPDIKKLSGDDNLETQAANGMFMINLCLVQILEQTSEGLKSYTGDIPILDGWTEQFMKQKDELMPILVRLYKENKTMMDKVLSATNQYIMFMLGSALLVTTQNTMKKKKN